MPLPPLSLLLQTEGLQLHAQDAGAAREEALVDPSYRAALATSGACLESIVPRTQQRGTVETQYIAGKDAVHEEREAQDVACGDEVGFRVDVDACVMRRLRFE